jgi:hypothetical protein
MIFQRQYISNTECGASVWNFKMWEKEVRVKEGAPLPSLSIHTTALQSHGRQ